MAVSLQFLAQSAYAEPDSGSTSASPMLANVPLTDSLLEEKTQIGVKHYSIGQMDAAENVFSEAIKQARLPDHSHLLASALINRGNARVAQEKFAAALADYLESGKLAIDFRYPNIAVRAYSNAARCQTQLGDHQAASHWLNLAIEQLQFLADNLEKSELELGLGHLLQSKMSAKVDPASNTELAYKLLDDGIRLAEALKLEELRTYGYGYLGELYLENSRLNEAQILTERAAFMAQSLNRPDILYRWQWQVARIFVKQGATAEAIAAYRLAIANLQPIRSQLLGNSLDNELAGKLNELYLEYADLILRDQTLSGAELLAVRELVEQSKVEELQSYYRDDCVTAWLNKSTKIDQLTERTAALYPIMLPDRLELLLSLPDGLRRYTVHSNRDDVRKLVEQLRTSLENRSGFEFLPRAQALHELLLKPALADLSVAGIDTLVFIPDATFRNIPLAALHDGKDFLIRNFAVVTSPGLTLTEPQPMPREHSLALVAGLSESPAGFSALPYVKNEIRLVAEQFPAEIMENQSFKVDNLSRQLLHNPYRIVHIASHGQFNRNVTNTFVLASDGKISFDALGSMLGVNRFRNEPVELLTLSACQTAAGDDLAALGLAGIAVKAGVRSALASLWFINDGASAELISEFYRQLKKPGISKAKSLQLAQLKLLDDERYDHPAYWAPFLMIGNWL